MLKAAALILLLGLGGAYLFNIYLGGNAEIKAPKLEDTYWGPIVGRQGENRDTRIRPFVIDVPKKVIDNLKSHLERERNFVPPLEETGWEYGISSKYMEGVIKYWNTKYDWSQRQALLNKYPQFVTNIQGLDIHFYHVKPSQKDARKKKVIPLLMVHGWPGSVVEFQKIIPMLTTERADRDFVFEIVAPSLPGYGFSQGAVRPGLGAAQIMTLHCQFIDCGFDDCRLAGINGVLPAFNLLGSGKMGHIFKNLMTRLGIKKFYTQGGDWGSPITASIASMFPDSVLGSHLNMCMVENGQTMLYKVLGKYFPSLVVDPEHESRVYPLSSHFFFILRETGYMHLQSTKPDTIGNALSESPVALATYMLEKFSTWTNPEYINREDGGLLEKYTMDELLDNVMVYWVTNSITTSMRLYAEVFSKQYRAADWDSIPITVPTACAAFPHELAYTPEKLLKYRFKNLTQYNHLPRGGHFAAFEEPGLLAQDVWTFVGKVESAAK